jgi:branched-chain amino acid transport system substrate-binding protein
MEQCYIKLKYGFSIYICGREDENMNKKIVLMSLMLLLASSVFLGMRPSSAQQTLKVGIIGPYYLPQWHENQGGMQGGAKLAMWDINAAGGINVGGTKYQIQVVEADEGAYNPLTGTYDPDKARSEIRRLLYTEGCKFIIGGFRTEVTTILIEETMDYNEAHPGEEVIFLINGASTDWLVSGVGTDYARYKWLFRINPVNSTMLFKNILGYLIGYLIPYKLKPMYGNVKYGYILEDLEWTVGIGQYLQYVGLGNDTTFVYGGRTPPGTTNFVPYLDEAASLGVRLICIAYTLPDAIYLVSQWAAGEYPFLLVGIDVFGQRGDYPTLSGGKCEYEIFEDFSGTRSAITPLAVKFWDNFVGNFSAPPIYTAWGAYNGLLSLKNALETAGTLNPSALVPVFEALETLVLNGKAKFTGTHDVYSVTYGPLWPDGYTRAMMVQWVNKGGTVGFVKEVVCPIDQSYSRKTRIPAWVYELSDVDLDFNGAVDIRDVARAARAFASEPGNPRWDPETDVIVDGKIDIRDIAMIARNFGKKAPQWPLP